MSNIFEQATRQGLRFNTPRGLITVEDLWNLPLTSINGMSITDIGEELAKQLEETGSGHFAKSKAVDKDLQLAFDIVKHIFDVITAEREASKLAVEKKAKRDKIKALISEKQDQALGEQSLEDLLAQLEELET